MSSQDSYGDTDGFAIAGEVDYTATVRKIATEFDQPGEIVREVCISNPMDAGATHIRIFPLYLPVGSALMVVDDGHGMDTAPRTTEDNRNCNGNARSSLESYFHVGHSTRRAHEDIGQFCCGAKLALAQADVFGTLVTRTARMEQGKYYLVTAPRMHQALSQPTSRLRARLVDADEVMRVVWNAFEDAHRDFTTEWGDSIRKALSLLPAAHGTLQIFVARETPLHTKRILDVERKSWERPARRMHSRMITDDLHATTLWTYLRFFTRHGSCLAFPKPYSAFKAHQQTERHRQVFARDTRRAEVRIYTERHRNGDVLPYGFPYITYSEPHPRPVEPLPAEALLKSRTQYWARLGPFTFTRDDRTPVAVFAAMDSYNARMEQWEGLGRVGSSRSGIGMSRVTGIVLSVHGVPVTSLTSEREFLEALLTADKEPTSILQPSTKEAFLTWKDKKKFENLTIFIDGLFEIKSDRNGITPAEWQRMRTERTFLVGVGNALQSFRDQRCAHGCAFREVVDYMLRNRKKANEDDMTDYEARRAAATFESGCVRVRPRVGVHPLVALLLEGVGEACVLPESGHEHMLVHLYGVYGNAVRAIARVAEHDASAIPEAASALFYRLVRERWHRLGLLFNGAGVDAQVFRWLSVSDDGFVAGTDPEAYSNALGQMEFKCVLEHDFSHPFAACEGGGIVANSIAEGLTFVHDSLDNRGELVPPAPHDSLYGIGRYLTNVHDSDGRVVMSRTDGSRPMRIPVVLFRPLLEATLAPIAHVDWRAPAVVRQAKGRAKRKR